MAWHPDGRADQADQGSPVGEGMRVLVVEDHRRLAEAVAAGLRDEGMAVDVAFDGKDALDHVALARYDVIVLDRDLPGLHGDEVCKALAPAGARRGW
jgi:DNA-binding response OmpR family regulator